MSKYKVIRVSTSYFDIIGNWRWFISKYLTHWFSIVAKILENL